VYLYFWSERSFVEKRVFIFLDFRSTYGIVFLEQCLEQLEESVMRRNCLIIQKRGLAKKIAFSILLENNLE